MDRDRRFAYADVADDLENVHRLRVASLEPRPLPPRPARDWTAALQAVYQATEQLNATETRARDIESRGIALAERALAELKEAEARIRNTEEALRLAEARADEAEARAAEFEARATEAEEWLARLNEAIQDGILARRPLNPRRAA